MTAADRRGTARRAQTPVLPKANTGHLKFGPNDTFHLALRRRVDRYFSRTGRARRDCPQMYMKTGIVLAWLAASYVLLVFVVSAWWLAVPLAVALGLAMAAVGFNVQHDG